MTELNPERVNEAELIVGIPSYNEADSIAFPVSQADEGIRKYFGDKKSVIINCDNDSSDNTKEVFMAVKTQTPKLYISTPPGVKGKGNNFRNLFKKAVELKAHAVVVVDADLRSITPEWIRNLGEPLFKGFAYVAPLYVRHKYDGTITNGIAYPMTRALYGRRVRQPIGGDFGFSGKLAKVYLESDLWDEAVSHFGIDIWMTTLAISQRSQVCQAFLGRPKIHRTKDPASHLGPMFRQVIGTVMKLMGEFDGIWTRVRYSRPTSIYGFGLGEVEMPPGVDVSAQKLFASFQDGFKSYGEVWKEILSEVVYGKLTEIGTLAVNGFDFPTDLWARLLFDAALAYRSSDLDKELLVDSLIPLYYGKTLSFVKKTAGMSIQQAEDAIEEDCMVFELAKPYLVKRWEKFSQAS